MNQKQINIQHMRIAKAVNKAYMAVDNGMITEKIFNSRLACADQARRTLDMNQCALNKRIHK